jgi:hypothetical protein
MDKEGAAPPLYCESALITLFLQKLTQPLRLLDGNRAHQDRTTFLVTFPDLFNNGLKLFSLRLKTESEKLVLANGLFVGITTTSSL